MKNLKEITAIPRKIAIYASMDMTDFYSVQEVLYVDYDEHYTPLPKGQFREYPKQGYVRITEPMEVTFTPISNDEVIAKAVESLDEEERKARDELNTKIMAIREKKSQLLALTHQVDA